MDNENKTYILALGLDVILSLAYHISSAITGAAVLARSYTGYDTKEATIMAAIGAPLTVLASLITRACSDNENSKTNLLNICIGAVISSLIGYGIYNEVDKTTMGLGQTAAASAVGASILVLPLLGISVCSGAALFYSTLENNEENLDRSIPLEERRRQLRREVEMTRIMLERNNKATEENNDNTIIPVEAVSARDIEPILIVKAVNSEEILNQATVTDIPESKNKATNGLARKVVNDYLKIV